MRMPYSYGLSCIMSFMFVGQMFAAAERKPDPTKQIMNFFNNKVIIYNKSGYSINLIATDPLYSRRIAPGAIALIGNDTQEVRDASIKVTFGYASVLNAGYGQKRGEIDISEQIKKQAKIQTDRSFVFYIQKPAISALLYSDWEGSFSVLPNEDPKIIISGLISVPYDRDPYKLPQFSGVNELVSTKRFAWLGGYYNSIDALKQDRLRWARIVLGLPEDYSQGALDQTFDLLDILYNPNRHPQVEEKFWANTFAIVKEAQRVAQSELSQRSKKK